MLSQEPVDAGAADGLVALPQLDSQGREPRRVVLVLLLFTALTAGTGLVDLLWPIAEPQLLGWEKNRREAQRKNAVWADGSKARWIESEIRTRSRVRQAVLAPYALGLYQGLREVRGDLLVGPGGWLFLRSRAEPRQADDGEIVGEALTLMRDLQERVAARGSRLVWVAVPRKSMLEAERLPPGVEPRPRLERLLADQARRQGIDFVDLLPMMADRVATGVPVYSRADSHWTLDTMVASAEEIARQTDLWVPEKQRRTTLELSETGPPRFDLLRYLGVRPTPETMRWLTPERIVLPKVLAPGGQPLGRLRPWKSDTEVALVGTSFSDLSSLVSFLEHATQVRILDATKAGRHPFRLLRDFVERRDVLGLPLPPTLLFEVPNHLFFEAEPLQGITAESIVPDPATLSDHSSISRKENP